MVLPRVEKPASGMQDEPGVGKCIFPGKTVMPLIQMENKTPAWQGSSIGNDLGIAPMTGSVTTTCRACDPACLWLSEIPQNPTHDGGRETFMDETCRHLANMSCE